MIFNYLLKGMKYVVKHKTIFSLTGIGAITGTSVASPFVVQAVNDASGNYLSFDGIFFANKESLANYINKQKTLSKFNSSQDGYILNDKYFNTISDVTKYLDEQYPITSLNTLHDPANYMLSGDGSLSSSVVTDLNDEVTTVYKNINNMPVATENEAIASYAKANSSIEYQVLANKYKTFEEAKRQYIDGIKKNLEADESSTYTVYERDGISFTEAQIKKALEKEMLHGFEYQGNTFFDNNYDQFKKYFADQVSEEFLEANIKRIKNPNMRTYWVQTGEIPPGDYFTSPKYVEVNDEVPERPYFTETSSTSINFFNRLQKGLLLSKLAAFSAGLVLDSIDNIYQNLNGSADSDFWNNQGMISKSPWASYGIYDLQTAKSRSLEVVLSELKKDNAIGETEFNDFMELYSQYKNEDVKSQLFDNLDKIHDDSFSAFNKLLIAFKRLNTFLKLYSTDYISPDYHLKLIESLRKIVLSYINLNAGSLLRKISNEEAFAIFKDLSFEQLYDYFINPAAFTRYIIGQDNKDKFDALLRYDDVIGSMLTGSVPKLNEISREKDFILNPKIIDSPNPEDINSSEKVLDWVSGSEDKILVAVSNGILDFLEQSQMAKLAQAAMKFAGDVFPPAKFIGKIWELGNLFSFSEVVNLEYKLDEKQKMEYSTMVYKMPFFGFRFTQPKQPDVEVIKLTDSILKFMTGIQSDENEVYEVNGHYYLNYRYAKDALLHEVYLHPEKYLPTKQVLVNKSFINRRPWQLFNGQSIQVGDGTNGTVSAEEYQAMYEAEIDQFIQSLFEQYYLNDATRQEHVYLDGFGNAFTNKEEAIASIEQKANDKSNYDIKYVYETINGVKKYFDSEQEREQFIYENEKVASKEVVQSELISHNSFSELPDYTGNSYKIFKVNFYGQDKYFYSEKLARDFIYNNVLPKTVTFDKQFVQYSYKNFNFGSRDLFARWVKANTTVVNNGQVAGQTIINIKKEDESNA